mmetsp:Transcript_45611/g.79759  ORF Transcript_45611/g.79759 Transcript_45611/m.79759 type:complete len:390 (-) Transcript_45611:560-1729(-)
MVVSRSPAVVLPLHDATVLVQARESDLHLAGTTGTEHVGRVHHRTQLAAHRAVAVGGFVWLAIFRIHSVVEHLELSAHKVASELAQISPARAVQVVLVHGNEIVGGFVLGSLFRSHQEHIALLEIERVDGEELVGAGFVSPDVALQHPVVPRQWRAQKGAHVTQVGAHQRQRHGLRVAAVVGVGIRGTTGSLAVDHHGSLRRVLHHRHLVLAVISVPVRASRVRGRAAVHFATTRGPRPLAALVALVVVALALTLPAVASVKAVIISVAAVVVAVVVAVGRRRWRLLLLVVPVAVIIARPTAIVVVTVPALEVVFEVIVIFVVTELASSSAAALIAAPVAVTAVAELAAAVPVTISTAVPTTNVPVSLSGAAGLRAAVCVRSACIILVI